MLRRMGIVLVVVGGLACLASCLGTAAPRELAARYHLRTRTERFFQRSTSAGRGASVRSRSAQAQTAQHGAKAASTSPGSGAR